MGGLLQFIFFLWLGWVALVVIYHVVVEVLKFLKEVLGSVFDAPDPPSRPEPSQVQRRTAADSQRPDHEYRKPWAPDMPTDQPRTSPAIRLSGTASLPTPKRPANLELAIDYNARLAGSSYLIVRVRGGPDGGRVGGITYSLSCTVDLQQQDYALGDRRSLNVIPEAFKGYYILNTPLPEDDSWATLAVIPLEQVLPPRGLTSRYQFKCLAYASAGRDYVGSPSPVGHVLDGAEFRTIFTLPGPGYLDEFDWISRSENILSFLEGLIRACEDDVPGKRSKLRSFVESLASPVTTPARKAVLKVAIERAYISARPGAAIDYGIIDTVRTSNDPVLVEAFARLVFQLACRESLTSEIRKAFAKIKATYDVNVNGHHVRLIDPLPPVAPVTVSVVTPKPAQSSSNFELKLLPVEEDGRVKAVEVHVRGIAGSLMASHPELTFWLWDEVAGDNPFLISAADIDLVHQRAVHHRSWKVGEYDSASWQSAGVIRFNEILPPSGGARRISVAGKFGPRNASSYFDHAKTTRTAAVTMNVASPGYETMRNRRQGLRYRAFVLAVGQALLSGKGPTYRQDKALKKFAEQLCSGITDSGWATSCRDELLVLIDSKVDDTLAGLTRLLIQLSSEADPKLRVQLLEALIEITASRQKRTKESRDFLEYSRKVLS
jgi:hypothetical protein